MNAKDPFDPLYLESVFVDPAGVFKHAGPSLEAVKSKVVVVLDTNVLLLPYGVGSESLQSISSVFRKLAEENRLLITDQVAREFAKHRCAKIAALYSRIADWRGKVLKAPDEGVPLVEGSNAYRNLTKKAKALNDALRSYQSAVDEVLRQIRDWGGADPVSKLYAELFVHQRIIGVKKPRSEVLEDLQRRVTHKIPPGFKDAKKEDGGIGDLLIWLAILEMGSVRKRHALFVTGDEKPDWLHKGDNRGLMPRAELVDEFMRASAGSGFYIASLSELLRIYDAKPEVVQSVRDQEEERRRSVLSRHLQRRARDEIKCPNCGHPSYRIVTSVPGHRREIRCRACGTRFLAERLPGGAVGVMELPLRTRDIFAAAIVCDLCGLGVVTLIPESNGTYRCERCGFVGRVPREVAAAAQAGDTQPMLPLDSTDESDDPASSIDSEAP